MSFKDTKKKIEAAKVQPAEQYNITKTLNTGIRVVKIAGIPCGVAYSDDDEKAMIEMLSHYGKKLETKDQVYAALSKMQESAMVATDLKEAGMTPDREFTAKNGKVVLEIDGVLYDKDGNELAK